MKAKESVGILIHSVADEGKVGGVERFFIKFYNWASENKPEARIVLITNKQAFSNLQYLVKVSNIDQVILLPVLSNRFKNVVESFVLLVYCILNRIKVIQIANFDKHSDALFFIFKYKLIRMIANVKLIATVVDCEIPYAFTLKSNKKHKSYLDRYSLLFNNSYLDAVITWYSEFQDWVFKSKMFIRDVEVFQIRTRFTIPVLPIVPFKEKENIIIWAGRLVEQKRPFLFLEAIKRIKRINPLLLTNWKVRMIGFGELKEQIIDFVAENDLTATIALPESIHLDNEFQKSKLFVSTQAFENYPSQTMNEAMIYGNALVAFNLGDTKLFLNDGVNGVFSEGESVESLADAITIYLNDFDKERSYDESVRLCKEVHNPMNFYQSISKIWTDVENKN
jgi:glycosyltransferase involved in cell wall biosynthesis